MILVSWNVNSLPVRTTHLDAWMRLQQPDVVCLQETKIIDDKFPKEIFDQLGLFYEFYGEKTYNGVAIISKYPLKNVQKGFLEEEEPQARRFIEADVNGIRVLNCYVPNGQRVGSDKYEYKLRWLRTLLCHLQKQHDPEKKLVLCGDFNIAPEDRDVYKPSAVLGTIMCSEGERNALMQIRDWGFEDVFRIHQPDAGHFSWWDYRMGAFRRNIGFRIDHIWATRSLSALSSRAFIDKEPRKQERPSDHAPVVAEFKI